MLKNKLNTRLQYGFTIVELLIVMGILAVLATFFINGYTGTQRKARDAQRKSDLKQLANASEIFYSDHKRYPPASGTQIAACPYNPATQTGTACAWGSGEYSDGTTIYFKSTPEDPTNAYTYVYITDLNGTYFRFYARLENPDDPDINSDITEGACHADGCNFAITSGNTNP